MEDITPIPLPDNLLSIWMDLEEEREKQEAMKENLVGLPQIPDAQLVLQIADQIVHQYIYGDPDIAKAATQRLEILRYEVSWDPKLRVLAVSI